jgi:glycosyltransferase involved in cell wall biosynthesis
MRVRVYSIVPSPYQRDLFYELSRCPEVDLDVYYFEKAHSDNPWPEKALQPYEQILPGGHLVWGSSRFHWNWHWPRLRNVDIVVFNGYQNLTAQLILHTQASTTPCIFWGEKMVASAPGIKGQLQHILAKGLEQCQAIVAIGSQAEQDYRQRFPGKPVFNIPYYCDLSRFSQNLPQRPRIPPTILFCGQMIQRKGLDLLLQAFAQVIQSGLQARLLLVGREAELPQMLQTLAPEVRQQIDYAGFQAPDDLPKFFRQADIFVLPSRYDGWGVVVNQALGAGLPIICSDAVGAAHDLIEPGVNGCIVPSADTSALAHALMQFLEQPDRLQFASQASINKSRNWSPAIGAQRWVEVFQAVTHPSLDSTVLATSIPQSANH